MDKGEAGEILTEVISELRSRTYAELCAVRGEHHLEQRTGATGTRYQVEVQLFWDGKPDGDLRVLASIDDGGFSAFKPLTDDFIIAPDGSFVGE